MTYKEYRAIHWWLRVTYGKATYCSNDPNHKAKRYDWANISGEYKKDINDYKQLCRPCHFRFDGLDKKQSIRAKGNHYRRRAILQIDSKNKTVHKFNSIEEASMKTNIIRTGILNCLGQRSKTAGKWRWKYANA